MGFNLNYILYLLGWWVGMVVVNMDVNCSYEVFMWCVFVYVVCRFSF